VGYTLNPALVSPDITIKNQVRQHLNPALVSPDIITQNPSETQSYSVVSISRYYYFKPSGMLY